MNLRDFGGDNGEESVVDDINLIDVVILSEKIDLVCNRTGIGEGKGSLNFTDTVGEEIGERSHKSIGSFFT